MPTDDRVLDLLQRWEELRQRGEEPSPEGLCADCPELLAEVARRVRQLRALGRLLAPEADLKPTLAAPPAPNGTAAPDPERLGCYRILARLGAGTYGVVYKARDTEVQRLVAIKVPHRHRLRSPADASAYLAEAQALAQLDHPGIVPLYHFGRTEDGLCYLVSKFVEGSNLAARLARGRPPAAEAADLVARVARALHHAHQHGLVHRDVKPANILLDAAGRPVVADFGLARRDEDFGTGPTCVGTPLYMSPEQVCGEGHRVDARTDVYSLGVVLYELLTGRLPFAAGNMLALFEQIKAQEARPPRQLDDAIPKALDRVCLKCLAKRAGDRFSTALDLAEELEHWLGGRAGAPPAAEPTLTLPAPAPPATPPSSRSGEPVKVIPKGLRSFDGSDADFFLGLLPGPRDRDGLPDGVRFWKRRVEAADPEVAFSVGVLYGPSGCGKSSLVKAGLLPGLADHVLAVYVEATAADTEARLLRGLRRHCPALPDSPGLADALAHLRRGHGLPGGRKVLLVIDQLEQWLHAHPEPRQAELVRALRQCDGEHVQCLVLVRDDFWMATTRFMRDLEVPLREGHNSAAVDLFDPGHARRVLAAFGRAFGALPDGTTAPEQQRFLEQAVAELAREGQVVPVRLSLFAEMVRRKPWVPATLKAVGGAEGIGVLFLEDAFSAATAPPEHRRHKQAARSILQALLPESGTDIKGHLRRAHELLSASGYARQPQEFERVLTILDGELRLVTPTDPEGVAGGGWRVAGEDSASSPATRHPPPATPCYQLAHDYLVPALRQWLTRERRQTRRGRAELCLAERAAAWQGRREKRHLPSGWEWATILAFTTRRDRTGPQQEMMRAATRHYLARGTVAALLALLLVVGGGGAAWQAWQRRMEAAAAAAAERDRALLAALLEVRGPRRAPRFQKDDGGLMTLLAEPGADEQFAAAFRAWGLDVDGTPTAEAEARLKGWPAHVVSEVIAALDEWAGERRRLGMPAAKWQPQARLVAALDGGPGAKRREELRDILDRDRLAQEWALATLATALRPVPVPFDAGLGEDRDRLRRLAAETEVADEPVLGLLTLARALRVAGDAVTAELLLRAALLARPQEVVLHNALGRLLVEQQTPRWREAAECYAVVRALRPELGGSLAQAQVMSGRLADGLALYRRLEAEQPENPWLPFERGVALYGQRRYKAAEEAFHAAVRLRPDFAEAHNNLGAVLYGQGRYPEAEAAYRKATDLQPDFALAHAGRGAALRYQERYPEAEAACRRATDLRPDFALAYNNLGAALTGQIHYREAEVAYREAIRLQPDYAPAHLNRAIALRMLGRFGDALESLRRGYELSNKAPDAGIREYERLVELERKLPALLRGDLEPAGPAERVELAGVCGPKRLHRTAVRLYADAFAADPKLTDNIAHEHRYDAACSAARAAAGQTDDAGPLPDKVALMLRRQALQWLGAELALYGGDLAPKPVVRRRLTLFWRRDADLASVCDTEALDQLPDDEQAQWRRLWDEAAALLKKVEEKK